MARKLGSFGSFVWKAAPMAVVEAHHCSPSFAPVWRLRCSALCLVPPPTVGAQGLAMGEEVERSKEHLRHVERRMGGESFAFLGYPVVSLKRNASLLCSEERGATRRSSLSHPLSLCVSVPASCVWHSSTSPSNRRARPTVAARAPCAPHALSLQRLAAQQQHPILCVAPEGLSQKLNFCLI